MHRITANTVVTPSLFSTSDRGPTRPATLTEQTLFFDPPYRNAFAETWAWNLVKYLRPTLGLRADVRISGGVRVDFFIEGHGRTVALLTTSEADLETVVASGVVDVAYAVEAGEADRQVIDMLFLLSEMDPGLFSERGLINLCRLASEAAQAAASSAPIGDEVHVTYAAEVERWELDGEEVAVEPTGNPGASVGLFRAVAERMSQLLQGRSLARG